jgi:uncharacterized membrane protein
MKVSRKQAVVLRHAIHSWKQAGLLDPVVAAKLDADLDVSAFDWKKLAKYSFWVAIVCIVISVGAVLADQILLEMLAQIFNAPPSVKCLVLGALSACIYGFGLRRRTREPDKEFSNEAILFIGVLTTAGAVYQFGKALDNGSGHFSVLLLLSFFIYGVLGLRFKSNLIWLFALVSLGSWMGAETGYESGWGAYYLGMNYPLRFVLFGAVLTVIAFALAKHAWFAPFHRSTLAAGLLYLFIALWIMSIFGNYGDVNSWQGVKQYELFKWSILFGLAAVAAVWHGLRYGDAMTKGFGLTFLFLNLYTRYFEYLWNGLHKALFFAILALSFWYLGSKAETIWRIGEGKAALQPAD